MTILKKYLRWKLNQYFPRKWLYRQLEKGLFRLDTTHFFFDKPQLEYQPLPWLGMPEASLRGQATKERWQTIKPILKKNSSRSLQDIGCCLGYFCISATQELGMQTRGIDFNKQFLRTAEYATPEEHKPKCRFLHLLVDSETVNFLPQTDATLCLSVWHHWVYYYGLATATKILDQVWKKTNQDLFFESGEEETKEEFKLPFKNTKAKDWLLAYLKKTLKPNHIEILGTFSAGDYQHYKIKNMKRHLFHLSK